MQIQYRICSVRKLALPCKKILMIKTMARFNKYRDLQCVLDRKDYYINSKLANQSNLYWNSTSWDHVFMHIWQAFHYPLCCISITIKKKINSKLVLFDICHIVNNIMSLLLLHLIFVTSCLMIICILMFLKALIDRP